MKISILAMILLAATHVFALETTVRKVDVLLGRDISCTKTSTLRLEYNYTVVTDTPEGAEYRLQTADTNLKAQAGLQNEHPLLKAPNCTEEGLKSIGDHLRMHFHHISAEATITTTRRNNFGIIVTTEKIEVPVEGIVLSSQVTTRQPESQIK